jgi:hypothetical protein
MDIRVAIFEDNKLMREGFGAICNGTLVLPVVAFMPIVLILITRYANHLRM